MGIEEELRKRLEESFSQNSYQEATVKITIELADSGMIVRYQEPVKHTREERPHSSANIMKSVEMQAFLVGMLEAISGGDEEWQGEEQHETKASRIKKRLEKALGVDPDAKPKIIEEWRWEPRTAICKDAQDLAAVIEKAKEARTKAEELRRSGKHVLHGGGMGLGDYTEVGQAYIGSPVMGPAAPPFGGDLGPDFAAGA